MTRYYGVKSGACEANIPLAIRKASEGNTINICFVPLVPVTCPKCSYTQQYGSEDSLDFDDVDGLPLFHRP